MFTDFLNEYQGPLVQAEIASMIIETGSRQNLFLPAAANK
jgi:hypothetical protein